MAFPWPEKRKPQVLHLPRPVCAQLPHLPRLVEVAEQQRVLTHDRQRPLTEEHARLDWPEQCAAPVGPSALLSDHQKVERQEVHLLHRLVRRAVELFPVWEPEEAGRAAEGKPRQLVQLQRHTLR